MRIAFLVRAYPTVSETFIRDQIEGLRARGISVDVYSLYRGSPPPDQSPEASRARYLIGRELPLPGAILRAAGRSAQGLMNPGALLRLVPISRRHPRIAAEALHAVRGLSSAAAGGRYDVVHAHYGPTGMLGLALRQAGLLTGPLVTTFHGIDLARYPRHHGQDCYRWLFKGAAALTVNSRFAEARALALGAPPHILHRLPMGVDLDSIPFRPPSPPTSGPFRLLSVGRLEEVKGISFGLRAVQALIDRGVDVRYTVVGDGRLKQALRTEAADLAIDSVVHFTGALSLPRVVEEMQHSHLFLMPGVETSDRQAETQGRVLVEAQAVGLPIVASRVGGIPETLGPGAGVLVEPRDVTGLADALDRVLGNTAEWKDMARSGRSHVERVFDESTLLDRLVAIYRGAANRSGVKG